MNIDESFNTFKTVLLVRNLSDSTNKSYFSWIRRFLTFLKSAGIQDTSEITLEHARSFTLIQHKNYAPATYNVCVCAVTYYYEAILAMTFPKRYLPYSKVGRDKTNSFSDDQLWEIITKAPDYRLKAAIVLCADTGMRISELLSIRFRDIDKKRKLIVIEQTKRDKSRTVEYSSFTRAVLNEYVRQWHVRVAPDAFLFPSDDKKRPQDHLSKTGLSKQFHDFIQGLSFYIPNRHKFHSLRHYFATSKIDAGAQLLTVRDQMGHTSSATTEGYVHSSAVPQTTGFAPLDKWEDRIEMLQRKVK